jgi:tRNA modification GTPase
MIEELFRERGAVVVTWQEFVADPFLVMLANAPTTRTAAILLDQANGAWHACIENGIDAAKLRRLEELIPLGRHLVEPWKIVIAGAPNVGKSSLINALAGYTRSIVSPIPGTTRDVVRVRLAIDGWPVEMIDTAGMRESSGDLERQGIERALSAASDADLRVWLLDGSVEPVFPANREAWQFVINKIDLPPAWDWDFVPAIRLSAQTHAGLGDLCERISRHLIPQPPAPGEAVPCLAEQVDWVHEQLALQRGR